MPWSWRASISHVRIDPRVVVLSSLLLFHFYTRHAAEQAIPLSTNEGLYPSDYRVALSLLEGRGFHLITFPDTPESRPLLEFTMMSRAQVSREELAAYFRQPYSAPVRFDSQRRVPDPPVSASDLPFLTDLFETRVLDIRVAALLWSWFGVRWSVYFVFYSLVSTLAAFCVFLIGRKAGGYWAGIIALLFYTACPLENEYVVRGVRDISPLWFALFGFAFTVCLAGVSQGRWVRMTSYVVAGIIAVIGYGWRTDALLLPPFLLAFLIGSLMVERRFTEIPRAAVAFAVGTALCLAGIRAITPGEGVSPQRGFHMAYYGHAARANLLGIEDSLNIYRCDIDTHLDANYYAVANGLEAGGEPYLSAAYGSACRRMFVEAVRYDSWHIVSQFPIFLYRALLGSGLRDLPVNTDYFMSRPRWTGPVALAQRFVLTPLYRLGPYLTVLGLISVLFWVRPVTVAAGIAAFLCYYGAILLSVLPEYKHTGLLVLPLCVLSGLAVTSIVNGSWRKVRWKAGGIASVALIAIWGIACGVAYPYSVNRRAALIDDIRKVAAGAPETAGGSEPQRFMVRLDSHDMPDRAGYLLEIDAGHNPASLSCRTLREADVPRYYESNHQLLPDRKQFFFVTSYFGANIHASSLQTLILLEGDARIVSARKVDLTNWKHLEVSTVFYDGERSPGSPSISLVSNRTIYAHPRLDENLLTAEEHLRMAGGHARQVVALASTAPAWFLRQTESPGTMSIPAESLAAQAGAVKILESGFVRFRSPEVGGQSWLQSPSLTLDREGTVFVQVRYRLRKGNLAIAVYPAGEGTPHISQQAEAERKGDFWIETSSLRLRSGQSFFLVIANGYAPLDQPTDAEISEIRVYVE